MRTDEAPVVAEDTIKAYLRQLQGSLPRAAPIDSEPLYRLHAAGDYEGMLRFIRTAMNLEVRLRVGWVTSGGPKDKPNAPAWIELPAQMPHYGSAAFKNLTLTVFFRKSFLAARGYDEVAVAIAHELSHIVLDAIGHPLRREEKAVDLTAMLLGFRRLYRSACHKERRFGDFTLWRRLGYLTPDEVARANRLLARQERDARIKAFCRRHKRVLVAAAVLGLLAAFAVFAAIAALMVS